MQSNSTSSIMGDLRTEGAFVDTNRYSMELLPDLLLEDESENETTVDNSAELETLNLSVLQLIKNSKDQNGRGQIKQYEIHPGDIWKNVETGETKTIETISQKGNNFAIQFAGEEEAKAQSLEAWYKEFAGLTKEVATEGVENENSQNVSKLRLIIRKFTPKGKGEFLAISLKPGQIWQKERGGVETVTIESISQRGDYSYSLKLEGINEPIIGSRDRLANTFSDMTNISKTADLGSDEERFVINSDLSRKKVTNLRNEEPMKPVNNLVGPDIKGGINTPDALPTDDLITVDNPTIITDSSPTTAANNIVENRINTTEKNASTSIDPINNLPTEPKVELPEKEDFQSLLVEFEGQIDRHNRAVSELEELKKDLAEAEDSSQIDSARTQNTITSRLLGNINILKSDIGIKQSLIEDKEDIASIILDKLLTKAADLSEMKTIFGIIQRSKNERIREYFLNEHVKETLRRNIARIKNKENVSEIKPSDDRNIIDDTPRNTIISEPLPADATTDEGQKVNDTIFTEPNDATINQENIKDRIDYSAGYHTAESKNPSFNYGFNNNKASETTGSVGESVLPKLSTVANPDSNLIQNTAKSNELVNVKEMIPAPNNNETPKLTTEPVVEAANNKSAGILKISPTGNTVDETAEVRSSIPSTDQSPNSEATPVLVRREEYENRIKEIRNRVTGDNNVSPSTKDNQVPARPSQDFFANDVPANQPKPAEIQNSLPVEQAPAPTVENVAQQPVPETTQNIPVVEAAKNIALQPTPETTQGAANINALSTTTEPIETKQNKNESLLGRALGVFQRFGNKGDPDSSDAMKLEGERRALVEDNKQQ